MRNPKGTRCHWYSSCGYGSGTYLLAWHQVQFWLAVQLDAAAGPAPTSAPATRLQRARFVSSAPRPWNHQRGVIIRLRDFMRRPPWLAFLVTCSWPASPPPQATRASTRPSLPVLFSHSYIVSVRLAAPPLPPPCLARCCCCLRPLPIR